MLEKGPRNFRLWKWNATIHRRPLFFFFLQFYLALGWFHVTYYIRTGGDTSTIHSHFGPKRSPFGQFSFCMAILHLVLTILAVIPLNSLREHFNAPSGRRLCEWSALSSCFLTLTVLVVERRGIQNNYGGSTILFWTTMVINALGFNHVGIPDTFITAMKLCMVPLWIDFLVATKIGFFNAINASIALSIIYFCSSFQLREYHMIFASLHHHNNENISFDFMQTILDSLKTADKVLQYQTEQLAREIDPRLSFRATSMFFFDKIYGSLIRLRYWYRSISLALTPADDWNERVDQVSFTEICQSVFVDIARNNLHCQSLFIDTTAEEILITAPNTLLKTIIFTLFEYIHQKDSKQDRVFRLSCSSTNGRGWKLSFECSHSRANNDEEEDESRGLQANDRQVRISNQHRHPQASSSIAAAAAAPLDIDRSDTTSIDTNFVGRMLNVIAGKHFGQKFDRFDDDRGQNNEVKVERIEVFLPQEMCTPPTQPTLPNIAMKYKPWLYLTQRLPELAGRTVLRDKLNQLLIPTNTVAVTSLARSQQEISAVILVTEDLLMFMKKTVVDYPDLVSCVDISHMSKCIIVVSDHDITQSDIETKYDLKVQFCVNSNVTTKELFQFVKEVSKFVHAYSTPMDLLLKEEEESVRTKDGHALDSSDQLLHWLIEIKRSLRGNSSEDRFLVLLEVRINLVRNWERSLQQNHSKTNDSQDAISSSSRQKSSRIALSSSAPSTQLASGDKTSRLFLSRSVEKHFQRKSKRAMALFISEFHGRLKKLREVHTQCMDAVSKFYAHYFLRVV